MHFFPFFHCIVSQIHILPGDRLFTGFGALSEPILKLSTALLTARNLRRGQRVDDYALAHTNCSASSCVDLGPFLARKVVHDIYLVRLLEM